MEIGGYEQYRGDLVLMYFVSVDPARGMLTGLRMTPMRIRNFRLVRPSNEDVKWLRNVLDRECGKPGTGVEMDGDGSLRLR